MPGFFVGTSPILWVAAALDDQAMFEDEELQTQITESVTVIATDLMQPLGVMVEQLGRTRHFERGLSMSVILHAVVMFESWLARSRFDANIYEKRALDYYDSLRQTHQSLPDVTEIFVLRDALAHNHLWRLETDWSEEPTTRLLGLILGGDSKYRAATDLSTGLTKAHSLHVVPTQIVKSDAKKVLSIVGEAIQALCEADLLMKPALHAKAWLAPAIPAKGKGSVAHDLGALIALL